MVRVRLDNGQVRRCHANQVRHRTGSTDSSNVDESVDTDINDFMFPSEQVVESSADPNTSVPPRSYPSRNRIPPARYIPSWSRK